MSVGCPIDANARRVPCHDTGKARPQVVDGADGLYKCRAVADSRKGVVSQLVWVGHEANTTLQSKTYACHEMSQGLRTLKDSLDKRPKMIKMDKYVGG
jgi:hypothetical protein